MALQIFVLFILFQNALCKFSVPLQLTADVTGNVYLWGDITTASIIK